MRRGVKPGMKPVTAGILALLLLAVGVYFGVTKRSPFDHRYELQAVFKNANLIAPRSPLRVSGVDIGKVTSVERYKDTNLALIKIEVNEEGLPIHEDARIKIRPRLFLEGNFFLDLQPGTPSKPALPDGGMIPVTQTSTPVQIDQLLTALQSDVRADLQKTFQGFGEALDSKPSAGDDARQDPSVRGLTGAQALNKTFNNSPYALRDTAVVLEALRGEQLHDLSRTIRGFARATKALADNQSNLRDLIGDFNTTMGAFASRSGDLATTVRLLGPTAHSARAAFVRLDQAMPPTRRFVRDLTDGVNELPATIAAAKPWFEQAMPLLTKREAIGLLDQMAPATASLAKWGNESRSLLPPVHAFNRCMTKVFLPTLDVKVDDGPLSSGVENYKEFWYAMVGQTGESQGFDGNGPLLRLQAANGAQTIKTGISNYSQTPRFANVTLPPLRTRPAYPNKLPQLRRDVPCYKNSIPDVNGPASIGPADGSRPGAGAPPSPPATSEVVGR